MWARNRLKTTVLVVATLVATPAAAEADTQVATPAAAEADTEGCDPRQDASCFPTREECAEGGHDGIHLDEETVFPGALCVSANSEEGTYVAGDPTVPCGTIGAGGVTVVDTEEGDPNGCGPIPGVREWGYLRVEDGTRLRYTVIRPDTDEPVPVAMQVSPYDEGGAVFVGPIGERLLLAGYALVGFNVRGTGCSEGEYDVFRPYSDLYEMVEWAAARPWSTGDVGMVGMSAVGLTQLYAASTRPPSLRAITPFEVVPDIYRDFIYPGGILNVGYGGGPWVVAVQPAAAALAYPEVAQEGDTDCFATQTSRRPWVPPRDRLVEQQWYDDWYEQRNAITWVDLIDVPVLACQAWQDDQTLSSTAFLDQIDPRLVWTVFTNGYHGACDYGPELIDLTLQFFDEFVHPDRSVDFTQVPRVQLWHEARGWDATEPSWVTTHPQWPPHTRNRVFQLGDGTLLDDPPSDAGAGAYGYPLGAASVEPTNFTEPESVAWSVPPVPGGYVAWTTPPLAEDLEIFGTGSLDLWLTSTAPDTDLQVTLTEVRPDGQEMYLRRGWLRASRRALDHEASTAVRPVHTHRRDDVEDLPLGEPTLVRIEIPPINHVFRAGSSVRVIVDAPTGRTGFWQFQFTPTPAVNTVLHGPEHPSRLVLGVIPGGAAPEDRPLPTCGEVLRTPCRDDPFVASAASDLTPEADDDEAATIKPALAAAEAELPSTGGSAAMLAVPLLVLVTALSCRRRRARRPGPGERSRQLVAFLSAVRKDR